LGIQFKSVHISCVKGNGTVISHKSTASRGAEVDPTVLVVGEALIDLLVEDDPRHPTAYPGGSPANTAISLARLGTSVAFAGRFGNDRFGDLLLANLGENGVHLGYAVDADEPSSLAVVTRGTSGAAFYGFHVAGTADWAWTEGELPEDPPAGMRAVHAGSLAVALPPGADTVAAWFRRQRGRCTTSLDPNIRPALVGPREDYLPRLESLVEASDIVKVSHDDLEWAYPGSDPVEIAHWWQKQGPTLVVVTLGDAGSTGVHDGRATHQSAPSTTVVDTVGAGDAFSGGLLHWLCTHDRIGPDHLARLTSDELRAALNYANTVAALACEHPGADPPRENDVAEALPLPLT
jgi:fructokinase